RADGAGGRAEVRAGVAADDVERAVPRTVAPALGGAVNLTPPRGDVLNWSGRPLAASQPLGERRVVRQADHLDCPLDRLPGPADADLPILGSDRHDSAINGGRQPPIAAHLLVAIALAFRQRTAINEPEVDRLS